MKGKKKLLNILVAIALIFAVTTNAALPAAAASDFKMATSKATAQLTIKSRKTYKMFLGDYYQIKSSLGKKASYSTEDSSIAYVNASGVLIACGTGTTELYIKKGSKTIKAKVTVLSCYSLSSFNTNSVSNNGKHYPFRVNKGYKVTIQSLTTYHYNGGKGKKPGYISLYKSDGKKPTKKIAKYKALGGYKNQYWNVTMQKTLSPGNYCIVDSDRKTWSQNSGSKGYGFVTIRFTDAQ